MTTLTYLPQVFDVLNMQSAREVILTHEGAASAEERWQTETPYVADLIENALSVTSETTLIDYGCGIGRLAKELITRHGCRVIGVDISINMRALAVDYGVDPEIENKQRRAGKHDTDDGRDKIPTRQRARDHPHAGV